MEIMVFAVSNTLVFLFSCSFLVSLLYSPPLISGEIIDKSCSTTSNYTSNSTFESNLNTLLLFLTSNASISGFYNATYGDDPNRVYGLLLCRGDVTPDQCRKCSSTASQDAIEACPKSKNATIWEENCMLRYAGVMFVSVLDNSTKLYQPNAENIRDSNQFNQVLTELLGNLSSAATSGGSTRFFATGDANFSSLQKVYGLMQCTEDLSTTDCSLCLQGAIGDIPTCCEGRKGARVLRLSCNLRYEVYPFYQELEDAGSAPPFPSPTSIAAPPASAALAGSGGISSRKIAIIVAPAAVGTTILLCAVYIFFLQRKAKTKSIEGPDFEDMDSLQFSLSTIKAATSNFSSANKLGQGGFGAVYKGRLLDGQEIAVKRLFRRSNESLEEFKNEVALVAKLQHRNLVRLLGCCLEGDEQILIFEYVPNKSLDKFLYDPTKRACLDWETRDKIIGGIARGLLYLHEDSRLKIIHRDLKVSNILLDVEMNAKISDFGTARLFEVGQTQGSTSRIAGTYGYMAPEYAMHGKFSIKSDVFSFGVIVLEIVSGLKNYGFHQSDLAQDLPSYAWKHWMEGTLSELIDPILADFCPRMEVMRFIHIGLLCVQEHVTDRPTMSTVVHMLSNDSIYLPSPSPPVFSMVNKTHADTTEEERDSPGSNSDQSEHRLVTPWSENEISSTEMKAR